MSSKTSLSQSNWATSDIVKQHQQKYARLEQLFDPLASFEVFPIKHRISRQVSEVYIITVSRCSFSLILAAAPTTALHPTSAKCKFSRKLPRDKGNPISLVWNRFPTKKHRNCSSNSKTAFSFQTINPCYQLYPSGSRLQVGTSRIYYASSDCSLSAPYLTVLVVSAGWNTSRGYSVQIVDEKAIWSGFTATWTLWTSMPVMLVSLETKLVLLDIPDGLSKSSLNWNCGTAVSRLTLNNLV